MKLRKKILTVFSHVDRLSFLDCLPAFCAGCGRGADCVCRDVPAQSTCRNVSVSCPSGGRSSSSHGSRARLQSVCDQLRRGPVVSTLSTDMRYELFVLHRMYMYIFFAHFSHRLFRSSQTQDFCHPSQCIHHFWLMAAYNNTIRSDSPSDRKREVIKHIAHKNDNFYGVSKSGVTFDMA